MSCLAGGTVIQRTSIASLGQYDNLRISNSKVLLFRLANLSNIQVLSRADKLELVKPWVAEEFRQIQMLPTVGFDPIP
jgi:hypothetical protein